MVIIIPKWKGLFNVSGEEDRALLRDITDALAVLSISLGASNTITGSITYIYDASLSQYWQLLQASNTTTTIILDLGILTNVRNLIIVCSISSQGGVIDKTFTTSYSRDNLTYTQIDTDTQNAVAEARYEHIIGNVKARYVKIVFNTATGDNGIYKLEYIKAIA